MTSLETSDHHVEHSARVDFSQKTEKELGELYTLQHNVERGQVMTNTWNDLESLAVEISKNAQVKEIFYTEMSKRIVDNKETAHEKERLLALLDPKKNPNLTPEYIDSVFIRIFQDVFFLSSFEKQDLNHLREYLPIIDEIRDGKCFAYGKQGESHAIQFDDFVIEEKKDKEGKNEGYTFVYRVYVDVQGSEKLKQMVRESDFNFGSAQVGGHKFDVIVKGDPVPDDQPYKDNGNLPIVKEINKDSVEYEQGKGKEKKDYKGVCLTDKNGRKTIFIRQDLSDEEKQAVIRHEISHLCGMVSEGTVWDEKTHRERPITLEDVQKDQKALLTATAENGMDDTKEERTEYSDEGIRALTANDVMTSFQGLFGEAKQAFEKDIQGQKSIFSAIGAAMRVLFTGLLKFLGDKLGLKLTPDESAEQDAASSKAAFEKVSDGLASPSLEWFKQQRVVVKGDKTWDDAWKDFMHDNKVKAYLAEAKKTENAAKYSYSDPSHAGRLLEEAAAFKVSGQTDAVRFYQEKHPEGEHSTIEKIKDHVKQTWNDMKNQYSNVELDDSFITALDIKEPLETSGQPDQNAYKQKIEALFEQCLGGIEGVKNWIKNLEVKTLTMEQIQFLKICKENDILRKIRNLDWEKVKKAYVKKLTFRESYTFTFESCFEALQNITAQQLKIMMTSTNPVWPSTTT